jgi:hypothetical protein
LHIELIHAARFIASSNEGTWRPVARGGFRSPGLLEHRLVAALDAASRHGSTHLIEGLVYFGDDVETMK